MNKPLPTQTEIAELVKTLRKDGEFAASVRACLDYSPVMILKIADALEALSAWQPIEKDPPQDGTEILLADSSGSYAGFWNTGIYKGRPVGWCAESDRGSLYSSSKLFPTHWRYLPTGPKEEEVAEALEKEAGR